MLCLTSQGPGSESLPRQKQRAEGRRPLGLCSLWSCCKLSGGRVSTSCVNALRWALARLRSEIMVQACSEQVEACCLAGWPDAEPNGPLREAKGHLGLVCILAGGLLRRVGPASSARPSPPTCCVTGPPRLGHLGGRFQGRFLLISRANPRSPVSPCQVGFAAWLPREPQRGSHQASAASMGLEITPTPHGVV